MIYAGNAASALGSLLRKAQEDRQKGPHLVPQSAQEESPIRQQIQGPISAPESVGSEKVVGMKGEMQPIQEGGSFAPGVGGLDNPSVVPPIVAPMAGDMAPVGPMGSSPMGVPSAMSSGIGSSLLPSSMKPGGGRAVSQGNVLGTSSPNFSLGQPMLPSMAKPSRQLAGRVSADYEKATPAQLANAVSVRQNPTTDVQKKAGFLGGTIDYLGQKLGNILPEKNISERLENWGGSRTVAATKPTLKSVIGKLFGKR